MDPDQRARTLALLAPAPPIEERAAGKDITPGGEQLHHYWTRGKGLAKWRTSPHPWTTLRNLLLEHVPKNKADRMASKWFEEVFGYTSGSDLHRVGSGKPPRGKRIGPG